MRRIGFAALLLIIACAAAPRREPERHLIYLHGRIVQDQQDRRPRHPQHGYYELDRIAETFRKRGFTVSAELRPKEITVDDAADAVVRQVRALLDSGVPPERITVVGASMGAGIAMRASARLAHPGVRFVALAPCFSHAAQAIFKESGAWPSRRMFVVREESDVPSSTCPKTDRARELVLHTGLAHGFIYRPLPEWVEPVVAWATAP
jgi:pimeloyl-ACP methyl ester carboxylesterase